MALKQAKSPHRRGYSISTVAQVDKMIESYANLLEAGFFKLFSSDPVVVIHSVRHKISGMRSDRCIQTGAFGTGVFGY